MVEVEAKEEGSLLSRAALESSVLVAMPSDLGVGGGLVPALGRISKIVKQSFFALVICSVTSMVAGFSLAKMSPLLALYPGLIILIPGAIDMRGTIFGTFGARLGTSLHTGEISPPLARSEPLRQQVGGVAVQVLSVSLDPRPDGEGVGPCRRPRYPEHLRPRPHIGIDQPLSAGDARYGVPPPRSLTKAS